MKIPTSCVVCGGSDGLDFLAVCAGCRSAQHAENQALHARIENKARVRARSTPVRVLALQVTSSTSSSWCTPVHSTSASSPARVCCRGCGEVQRAATACAECGLSDGDAAHVV